MDLHWFDDFLALAEWQNFSRAAEQRKLSQSALSRRIQALERWVGEPLVDRQAQPVLLTDAGERFLPTVVQLTSVLDEMDELRGQGRDGAPPRLTILLPDGASPGLTALLAQRQMMYCPHVCLRVDRGEESAVRLALLRGRARLGVMVRDLRLPMVLDERLFESKLIARDRVMPVVAVQSGRPAHRFPDSLSSALPIIEHESAQSVASCRGLRQPRDDRPVQLQQVHTVKSMDEMLMAVRQGIGVGFVFESMVHEALDRGELQCVRPAWIRPVELLLVRSRCAGAALAAEGDAVDAATLMWEAFGGPADVVELANAPFSIPRGALLLSDVTCCELRS